MIIVLNEDMGVYEGVCTMKTKPLGSFGDPLTPMRQTEREREREREREVNASCIVNANTS